MRSAVLSASIRAVIVALSVLPACSDECPRLRRCNVLERGCQRSVMETVACMRGGGGADLPPVRVIGEQEFIELLQAQDIEDEPERAERDARYALWTRGLSLFELAPAEYGVDDALADSAKQTGAAYLFEADEILIIDRGTPFADDRAVELFAHEVVHALQDQELDLLAYGERWKVSFDAALAVDAVVEGEAVHYQILAAIELAGRDPDELNWEGFYREWRSDTLLEAEEDEAPVALADMRFPYAFGGGYVSQHWLARGRSGIDALLQQPPRTTSEVMFGTSASVLDAEREMLAQHAVPEIGDPFELSAATELGAWIVRMYAARAIPTIGLRLTPSHQLAADLFSVHHEPASDALVAAWRVRTLPDASAVDWPVRRGAGVLAGLDTQHREAFSIAGDPELPAESGMLAWGTGEPEEGSDEEAASAAWRLLLRGGSRYRACALRRPELRGLAW